jgi:hypothetical protein
MATTVKVFYHSGISTAHVAAGTKFASDSVSLLKQPYLSRWSATLSGSAQSSSAAPAGTKIAYIQVQEGKAVTFEVNPPNRSTEADTSSTTLSGETQIEFGPEWTISFAEHTVV